MYRNDNERPLVLVVNDSEDMVAMLTAMLAGEGYDVLPARDGRDGIEKAFASKPDVVISDVRMPKADGYELVRTLKSDPRTSATPILLVSALLHSSADSLTGIETGADDYLEMPMRMGELLVKVARLAERSRVERRYRDLVEDAADIIFTCDADLRLTGINDAGVRFFGDAAQTLLGRSLDELREKVSGDEAGQSSEQDSVDGRRAIYRVRDAKGERRFLEALTKPILDKQDRVVGYRGIARDVTERRRAEDEVRQSEERFRLLVEGVQDYAIHSLDARGLVTSWNVGAERMNGYTEDEILGQHLSVFYTPEERANGAAAALRIAETEGKSKGEGWRVRHDASRFWVEWVLTALRDERGRLQGFSSLMRDVTERKRIEEERLRLQASVQRAATEWQLTFDSIQFPLLILNSQGEIRRLNKAARDLAGLTYDQVIGRAVGAVSLDQPWQEFARMCDTLHEDGFTKTLEVKGEDGKMWSLTANVIPDHNRSGDRFVVMARDVSKRVELEASLRRGEMLSMMGTLVAGVAHEVRNPLFAITSILDAFEARFGAQADYQRYVTVLRAELERLAELMNELLDYGKPFSLELHRDAVERIVGQTVRSCEPLASRSNVTIINKCDGEHEVLMDRRRLPKVFTNLLENAIRHTPAGSEVIAAVAEEIEGERQLVKCTIEDSGPGFKEEDLHKVFEPFFSKRRGGTGLGLSIVQRIVEEHGGEVAVGNRPEGGGRVTVWLPLAEER